jgi:chorismate mutase
MIRGIRGAITVETDLAELVLEATRVLLETILAENPDLDVNRISAAWFTTTPDLTSAFPAEAMRAYGWQHVPMLCAHEIPVPGSLPRCIRVLVLWDTEHPPEDIQHVYLRKAVTLRPEFAKETSV